MNDTPQATSKSFRDRLAEVVDRTPQGRAAYEDARVRTRLAEAMRRAREAAKHTQTTLADELDVRQSLVSKWERRDHNHTLGTLMQYLRPLGAKLVFGIEVNGELIPVSEAAERTVLFRPTVHQSLVLEAEERGLTVREYVVRATTEARASSSQADEIAERLADRLGRRDEASLTTLEDPSLQPYGRAYPGAN